MDLGMMLALSSVLSVILDKSFPFSEILFPVFRTVTIRSLCGATEQMATNVGSSLTKARPHTDHPACTPELSVVLH